MNALCDNELLRLSAEDCDRKWRNLMPTYRKIMDQKKKTGRGSVHWKFLEDMLQATKDRSSVMQELICWSVRQRRRHSRRTLQQYQLRCPHCQQLHWLTQRFRHRKRRKDFHKRGGDRNWLACFITYMDNHQKESEGRWQEARQLEAEKFSIFKELLKVMKKKQLLVYSKFLEMFLKFLMQHCKNSVDW